LYSFDYWKHHLAQKDVRHDRKLYFLELYDVSNGVENIILPILMFSIRIKEHFDENWQYENRKWQKVAVTRAIMAYLGE